VDGTGACTHVDGHEERLMNVSTRERKLALATGVLIAAAALYLLTDRWAIPAWRQIRSDIDNAEKDLARVKDVIARRDRRQAQYAAGVSLALHEATPADAELAFIKKLNALADQAAMKSPNITVLSPKGGDHYDLIQFNFTVNCTFQQFLAFLRHFYQHTGAHRVDTITVRSSGRYLSEDDVLKVTMVISAVVIPEEGKNPPTKRGGGT
jgi:type II secretory pathway component PulM